MKTRLAITLVMVFVAVGCGRPIRLLTGVPPGSSSTSGESGCFTNHAAGPLIADPTYGAAIIDTEGNRHSTVATPVMWRPGFTGRLIGSDVLILDPGGRVVATTGHSYRIAGGYVGGALVPDLPIRVFWACDFVIALP